MTKTEIFDILKQFLVEELEIDNHKVAMDAKIKDDIDIDSLDFADIAVFVEEKFGFVIKAEDLKKLVTINDFCNYIEQKKAN